MKLNLYKINDTWFFDDKKLGIKQEAFILGTSELITFLCESKNNFSKHCQIEFSNIEFTNYDIKLFKDEEAKLVKYQDETIFKGAWYSSKYKGKKFINYLCPTTLKYFESYPETIFIKLLTNNL